MATGSRLSVFLSLSLAALMLLFSPAFGDNESPNFSTECTTNLNLYTVFVVSGLNFSQAFSRCPLTKNGSGRQIARMDNSRDFEAVRTLLREHRNGLGNLWIGVDALNTTASGSGNTKVYFFTDGNNTNVNFIHGNVGVSPWILSNPNNDANDRCVVLSPQNGNAAQDYLMNNQPCTRTQAGVICREDCNKLPTVSPTHTPTRTPTHSPTKSPTRTPTKSPSRAPTRSPTRTPTRTPTKSPSLRPTGSPTSTPTAEPTEAPYQPTKSPSSAPVPTLPIGNSSISGAVGGAVGGVFAFLMLVTITAFVIMRRRGYSGNNNSSLTSKKNDIVSMAITTSDDKMAMIAIDKAVDEKSILKPKFLNIDSTPNVVTGTEFQKVKNTMPPTAFPIVSTPSKTSPPPISSQPADSAKHKSKKKHSDSSVDGSIIPKPHENIPAVDDAELLDLLLMEGYKKPATPKTNPETSTKIPLPIGMSMNTNVLQSSFHRKKDKNVKLDDPKEDLDNLSTSAARPESLYLNNLDNMNRPESIFRPSADYIKKAQDRKTKIKNERGTELSTDSPKKTNKNLDPKEPVVLDENEL